MDTTEVIERYAGRPLFVIPIGFAISLLLVLFGPYQNFSAIGYSDPWFYTGYFTNYSRIQHQYGTMYYFSRLPWTLPGLLMFQLASPVAASLLLNACLVATSAVSLYFAVRPHYGTAAALLTSLALATNPWFYNSVAWDYPDGPAIAYGFVALAFALRPNGRRALNTIVMAAFLALSGFTNMSGAPMILSILVFPLWRHRRSITELAREAVYVLAGVAAVTLALLPVSKLVLGYWRYFLPQIQLLLWEMGNPVVLSEMWGSGNGFLAGAYRLFPPAFLLIFGLVLLLIARHHQPTAWPAWLALLACCVMYTYQEFVMHGVALRVAYHSVYLIVPLFAFTGVALGEVWRRARSRSDWLALGGLAFFIIALPFLVDAYRHELARSSLWRDLFMTGAGTLLLLVGWRYDAARFRVPVMLLLVSVLCVGPGRELSVFLSERSGNREEFESLMRLQAVLKPAIPAERRAMFWLDAGETHADLFLSAQSLWVWGPFDFASFLSSASRDAIRFRLKGNTLVHLTDHPEKIRGRLNLLDSRGVHYENHREWMIRVGQEQFYAAADDVTDIGGIR